MGAWRKAGVWLGLVEDDPRYEDGPYEDGRYDDKRYESRRFDDRRYADDELDTYEDEFEEPVSRPTRLERSPSRPVSRMPATPSPPTHDNLALAPQLSLRERAVVSDVSEPEETSYRITTLHPTNYNEARMIGEQFRNHIPVILNLTEMDEADAKRLVDFAAGLTFGLRGSIERVTNRVFLLSPANVTVTAEDKARIAEGGFFNQS
ncbi:cell division protein SepF [Cryptosporangium aurantiacum]|uniref:Cell division protein SepF n=1 Tax=Cryptosporangium aurantiacum TaxID=134849 RepID=A0A1M7I619_9ACTN|nr:cell division protein SepF [Cryptosporangium aurantiacum]SHM35983.1 cell division inhibitor SepF [Cryptosporangium aurantiacum]